MSEINWVIPPLHRDYNRMSASIWIRSLQLIPYLAELGISSDVNKPEGSARIHIFVRSQGESALDAAHRLKAAGKQVVFDMAVNYFEPAELADLGTPVSTKHIGEALRMLEVADVITCASDYIAQRALQHHEWVEYLPDSIDLRHFSRLKSKDDFQRPRLTAAWSGVAKKAGDVNLVTSLLAQNNMDLVIVTNLDTQLIKLFTARPWRLRPKYLRWNYNRFPLQLLQGDFCIAPRDVVSPYNRGHSFFKIGVFMAQGIPVVASPVPSYHELLGAGKGGLLCATMGEWASALSLIQNDRTILTRWSDEARMLAASFSTERIALRYKQLFDLLGELHRGIAGGVKR